MVSSSGFRRRAPARAPAPAPPRTVAEPAPPAVPSRRRSRSGSAPASPRFSASPPRDTARSTAGNAPATCGSRSAGATRGGARRGRSTPWRGRNRPPRNPGNTRHPAIAARPLRRPRRLAVPRPRPPETGVSSSMASSSLSEARRRGHRPRGGGRGVLRRPIFEPVQLLGGPARAVQQTAVLQILHRLPKLRVLHFRADHLPVGTRSAPLRGRDRARVSCQSAHPRKTRREGAE